MKCIIIENLHSANYSTVQLVINEFFVNKIKKLFKKTKKKSLTFVLQNNITTIWLNIPHRKFVLYVLNIHKLEQIHFTILSYKIWKCEFWKSNLSFIASITHLSARRSEATGWCVASSRRKWTSETVTSSKTTCSNNWPFFLVHNLPSMSTFVYLDLYLGMVVWISFSFVPVIGLLWNEGIEIGREDVIYFWEVCYSPNHAEWNIAITK